MKTLLWLDDERNPHSNTWQYWLFNNVINIDQYEIKWVRNYQEFKNYVVIIGMPNVICFDHDLGVAKSGYDAAKWLTEYCMDYNYDLPIYYIQSANPVGAANIHGLFNSFKKFHAKK